VQPLHGGLCEKKTLHLARTHEQNRKVHEWMKTKSIKVPLWIKVRGEAATHTRGARMSESSSSQKAHASMAMHVTLVS
jgi:ribosomal protein L39E